MSQMPDVLRSRDPEAGNGTILMLAAVFVAFFALVVVLMFSAASHAAAKAATAADLAALAGADAARSLVPGEPCAVAGQTATVNNAVLTECTRQGVRGEIVKIVVKVPVSMVGWLPPLSHAVAVARAGPPPQPWLRMLQNLP